MKRLSQTLKVILALLVGVFSNNLWPAVASAYSTTNPVPSGGTVYVCKYKGTPGIDEVYKPGQNPIAVSLTANETRQVGTYFEDSQGRSYVVGWDNGDGILPTLQDCPAPQGGGTVTATAPMVTPVCGADNDTITYATTSHVTYSQTGWNSGSNTVSATADSTYTLTGTSSWTYTDIVTDGCMTASPTEPMFDDVCGTTGDTYTITATPGITYYVNGVAVTAYGTFPASGTVTVTATANAGYILGTYPVGGWSHTYEGNCVADEPAQPAPADPCGLANASWVLPANTSTYTWSIVAGHLIATTVANYEFAPGITTKDFGLAPDSGTLCITAVPADPVQTDPCGLDNASWTVPTSTPEVTWALVNGELVATTTANYKFDDGRTIINYGAPTESGDLCATVVEPTGTDYCGDAYDLISYDGAVGVIYSEEWNSDHTLVTITATADEGYTIAPETVTSWTLAFPNNESCQKITICDATASATNPYRMITVDVNAADGLAGNSGRAVPDHYSHTGPIYYDGIDEEWGDVIPAIPGVHDGRNLTGVGEYMLDHGCNVPAESTASYTVTPCVATSAPTADTFSITLTNTADDSEGDVTYTVTLGSIVKTVTIEDGESMTLSYPSLAAGSYSLAIAASDGTTFTSETVRVGSCGAILGDTDKPVTRVLATQTKTLPTELPATGGEMNYLFLGVVLSTATYFIVLRRQHA